MSEPKKPFAVARWHMSGLTVAALGLVAGVVMLTAFADSPGWFLLYPVLIVGLLVVSVLIVIGLVRRL